MESPSAQLIEPSMIDFGGPPSSPFVTEVDTQSTRSPSKTWRPKMEQAIEEESTSPAKAIMPQTTTDDMMQDDKENVPQQDATLAKMFATPGKGTSHNVQAVEAHRRSSGDAGLMPPPSTRKPFVSPKKTPLKPVQSTVNTPKTGTRDHTTSARTPSAFQAGLDTRNTQIQQDDTSNADDTCFSAFSEIPDMTIFAKLGQSPTKRGDMTRTPHRTLEPTPRTSRKRSSPSRSPSPTPRRQKTPASTMNQDETTSFLIDFTQQMEGVGSYRLQSPAKSATESNLLQYIHNQRSPNKSVRQSHTTPSKPSNILSLLDFELPPAPTPRSIPTITVRELESLKSSYLSQISNLKATLSGREAEVESLKKAVGDAERRVGEAQEALREEKSRREHVEQEKEGWEKRGHEVEQVLRSVKEEVIKGEAEKEDMSRRLEEVERMSEDAEARAVRAEERFADALAARAGAGEDGGDVMEEQVQRLVAAQIDAKVEAVSRELHTVYKEKHERKVATLKKSYETRSEKKTAELQSRLSALEKENQDLQATKDATFSGPVGETSMIVSSDAAELKVQLEEQKAQLARLASEMEASRSQQSQLEKELQQERIEKGDLVAAVDEMLALQQGDAPPTPGVGIVEDFRKSISRPSALRAPGGGIPSLGESRAGRSGGLPTPSSVSRGHNGIGKSKMLANIERMGRAGSRDGGASGLDS